MSLQGTGTQLKVYKNVRYLAIVADLNSLSLIIFIISDAKVSGSPVQNALEAELAIAAVISARSPSILRPGQHRLLSR